MGRRENTSRFLAAATAAEQQLEKEAGRDFARSRCGGLIVYQESKQAIDTVLGLVILRRLINAIRGIRG